MPPAVLPKLFGEVWTVPAVVEELRQPHFPSAVIAWAEQLPAWLKIRAPKHALELESMLDPGEADAISLAIEKNALRILIDERAGVRVAKQMAHDRDLDLKPVGTLTILAVAAERGHVDFQQATEDLLKTKFRCTAKILEQFVSMTPELKDHIRREGDLYPNRG